jgi:hypothetical protein
VFVCLVVVRTGSVHNSLAYKLSELSSKIQAGKLPCGSFLNGDDAYACSDHMVTPYHGRKQSADRDGFNYWQSKVRINIECAFGLLHARWGVLWRPIQLIVDKVPMMMMVLVKLHNMCIDDQGSYTNPALKTHSQHDQNSDTSQIFSTYIQAQGTRRDIQKSAIRDALRGVLHANKMKRPRHFSFSYM